MKRFVLLMACLMGLGITNLAPAKGNTVVIDRNYPARKAHLHPGDILVIKLRIQGGLGYKWGLGRYHTQVLIHLGTTNAPANPHVMGGPIDQTFRFRAISSGHSLLPFTLMHKASGLTAIAKHYRCDVRVTPKRF